MAIPSLMQKSFTDVFDEFLFACSHGDYLTVERLLNDHSIDHSDICRTIGHEKLSPMVIAIEHQHLEVIKILLDHIPYSDFREALLLAIYLDLTKIAQLIMEHDTFKCLYGTFADWQTDTVASFDESHFAAIRPIELAAQYNRTTILYHFLKRGIVFFLLLYFFENYLAFYSIIFGERIEVPHKIECDCNECKSAGLNDSLRYSQLRLSTYRGLSSDVYLALVSPDPMTSAFDLCNQLAKLIKNEPNLASEYSDLFNQVSHFSARLLDHVRNQFEVELLLTIERLNAAIEHNQQEFITHTNTQQRLSDLWYENVGLSRSNSLKYRCLASLYYSLLYFPMYIGYFWLPFCFENQCRWYVQQPAIQALIHSISYGIFLLILLLSGIFQSPKISLKTDYPHIFDYYHRLLSINDKQVYCQKTILSYWKIFVLIWMTGYVYRNLSKIIRQRRSLNIIDTLITILFLLYIVLFTSAVIDVHLQWQFISNIENWKDFERLYNESQFSDRYIQFENRLTSTHTSEFIDIQMIGDGVFTIIIVFCIIQLCIFFLISGYVGPLLVSLLTMSRTIYRWFIFILIFIFAYQTSFLHLFAYYSFDDITNHSNLHSTRQAAISRSFGNTKLTTINVIFSLFGLTKNELTQTYTTTHTNNSTDVYLLNFFTSTIGSLIYGSFAFFARIILMTMIIAYIKRIYNSNNQQVLNDWNFARAKLYMIFITKDPDVLPVPLNLIPTFRHIRKLCRKKMPIENLIRKRFSHKKYLRNLNYPSNQDESLRKVTADQVMNWIVLRFLTKYHPHDISSLKRTRQIQYKEELSKVRHCVLEEIQAIQQANRTLKKEISTVFFGLDQHERK